MFTITRKTTVLILSALVVACDSGPSDAEFVAACLKEGQRGANSKDQR